MPKHRKKNFFLNNLGSTRSLVMTSDIYDELSTNSIRKYHF